MNCAEEPTQVVKFCENRISGEHALGTCTGQMVELYWLFSALYLGQVPRGNGRIDFHDLYIKRGVTDQ